ncbi:MAG: pentapeptide repeat-containing protein [Thiohalophilus sp.]|uniref:pentapeptide repeat-containing protein n=1 Tax=Thiohalophilus sp. TaxID=3028392 RepID=UPI00286FFB0F|nr:pentapeptide repeat-containing protein [Thiohalophilus sp.]MDR9436739.1 pentapeptide repeat-containing protein [Thiohalophilus sp.]
MTKQAPLFVKLKQDNRIKGPFPVGQIAQSLLLGRFSLDDQVSEDRQTWQPIRRRPDLIPEVLKSDPGDEMAQERLQAARRWADERRPQHHSPANEQDQRDPEPYETLEYRHHREDVMRDINPERKFSLVHLILIMGLAAGLIALGFIYGPQPGPGDPDCNAPPAPGVNWRNCRMIGLNAIRENLDEAQLNNAALGGANLFASSLRRADLRYVDLSLANLSYADLEQANLKGAGLQNADLTDASLSNANLSYANLRGATLDGADLTGARLDHAIWIDGRTCIAGSIGECQTVSR